MRRIREGEPARNYDRRHWHPAALGIGALLVALTIGGVYWSEGQRSAAPPHAAPQHPRETEQSAEYPLHTNIIATVFWVGEAADDSNDYIHNRSSAWTGDWVAAYGGVDDPMRRCGYLPCGFTPKENPFYFALPFSDSTDNGLKPAAELAVVPWYDGKSDINGSILKNRWIEVRSNDKIVYAQWEDVGPFEENDASYVFGGNSPKESRAGLDVSPAVSQYLKMGGRATVEWRFVEEADVPDGPWRQTITRSAPES